MASASPAKKIKTGAPTLVGTKVPDVRLEFEFGKVGDVSLKERCKDKKIVLVGLPGAFTPT